MFQRSIKPLVERSLKSFLKKTWISKLRLRSIWNHKTKLIRKIKNSLTKLLLMRTIRNSLWEVKDYLALQDLVSLRILIKKPSQKKQLNNLLSISVSQKTWRNICCSQEIFLEIMETIQWLQMQFSSQNDSLKDLNLFKKI